MNKHKLAEHIRFNSILCGRPLTTLISFGHCKTNLLASYWDETTGSTYFSTPVFILKPWVKKQCTKQGIIEMCFTFKCVPKNTTWSIWLCIDRPYIKHKNMISTLFLSNFQYFKYKFKWINYNGLGQRTNVTNCV